MFVLLLMIPNFNPRSLHGERQSDRACKGNSGKDFNPRSLHGERRRLQRQASAVFLISIHAPCTGSDIFW